MVNPQAIDVVELRDYTAEAADLGLKCSVAIAGQLIEEVEPHDALLRLRDVLVATRSDPALDTIVAVALRGERPDPRSSDDWVDTMNHFAARCRAGVGGVSDGGTMLAMPIQGKRGLVMVVCQLGFGIVRPERDPAIVLTTVDASTLHIERMALRLLKTGS